MAKFNWKSIFVNVGDEGETSQEKQESTSTATSFPDSGTRFPNEMPKGGQQINQNTLNTIVEMYESGFESLNQPGYDFYEFFKAIKAVGSNDAKVYKMALAMAQGSDANVTKSSLLSQANFYIAEINKVHAQYETEGSARKAQLQEAQRAKKAFLAAEIAGLEKKLTDIKTQINSRKDELESIDASVMTNVDEIDQKIIANNLAKAKILETITTVVNGIKSNL